MATNRDELHEMNEIAEERIRIGTSQSAGMKDLGNDPGVPTRDGKNKLNAI